jgi:hypothetical protein
MLNNSSKSLAAFLSDTQIACNKHIFERYSYEIFIPQKLQTQQAETQASKGKDDEPPPPFAGLKLKPKRPVQRKPIEEPKKDTPFKVELKHHEFEKPPQTEEVNIEEIIKISIHFSI